MPDPRSARPTSAVRPLPPASASGLSQPDVRARRWRVRFGMISVLTIAVALPLTATAAAQSSGSHRNPTRTMRLASHTRPARRIHPVTAKPQTRPAVAVTTTAPKPAPRAVVTAPPTTRPVPPPTTRPVPPPTVAPPVNVQGSGRCGGALPPCYVMMRESRGSLTAHNPTSTASGKWQFLDSTWKGFGGYPTAASAPEAVQDARAAEVWAGGAGCSNWAAC